MDTTLSQSVAMKVLKRSVFLAIGYSIAIFASALFYAVLLNGYTAYLNDNAPSFHDFLTNAYYSTIFGFIFGLPYTIIGSLLVQFALPKRMSVFLLVGMFCPASALLILFGNLSESGLPHMVLLSFPPGLLAAYLYGAIGFGYRFKRWRF